MVKRRTEDRLRVEVSAALQERGNDVVQEFPSLGVRADIMALNQNGGVLTAYECKLTDWRRGISQARRHLTVCDEVYVVLPHRPFAVTPVEPFVSGGVGLMILRDGALDVLVRGVSTVKPVPMLRERALRHFGSRAAQVGENA